MQWFFYYSFSAGAVSSTIKLHSAWNAALRDMTLETAQAALFQTTATADEAAAQEQWDASNVDQVEATSLQEQAAVLEQASVADAAEAAADEATADELTSEAGEVQLQATRHEAAAAADEALAEEETATATELAATAAETAVEAHVDESAVAICQFFPGADVVCGAVGGLVATSLETTAAAQAAMAAADYAAAAGAQAEMEVETSRAAALEAEVASDLAQAADLSATATGLEDKAAEEHAQAMEMEEEADQDTAASVAAQQAGEAAHVEAVQQQEKADQLAARALQSGVRAIYYFLAQLVVAVGLGLALLVRLVAVTLLPTCLASGGTAAAASTAPSWMLRISTVWHISAIWFLLSNLFLSVYLDSTTSVSTRGGHIVWVSGFATIAQLLWWKSLFLPCRRPHNVLKYFVYIMADSVLLLASNVLGCILLADHIGHIRLTYLLAPVFLVTCCLHHCRKRHEEQQIRPQRASCNNTTDSIAKFLSEETALLSTESPKNEACLELPHYRKQVPVRDSKTPEICKSPHQTRCLKDYHYVWWEIWMTVVFSATAVSCLIRSHILQPLWPTFRKGLFQWITSHQFALSLGSIYVLLLLVVAGLAIRCMQQRKGGR